MQIVSKADNLHEVSNPIFCQKNKKNISICCLLKILPTVYSAKVFFNARCRNILEQDPNRSYGLCQA